MKASDVFIQALEREGVERIYGVPGEENLDMLESLRTSNIELILTRHEQGAAFMAATWGRLTGKIGVCMATLGPGATNLVTGAAYAQLGAMPLLMITGQKPIRTSKQGRFQIIDVVGMMRPITKFAKQLVDGRTIASSVREAVRIATEERPGAVHLELPEDIAAEDVAEPHFIEKCDNPPPAASQAVIKRACDLVHAAKRPLLLIGAGANRRVVFGVLEQFVNHAQIPFFTTQMGKGVIDERHPKCMGTAALSSGDYLHCAIERADVIINVGHDVIEKPPFFMGPNGPKVVHVNQCAAEVDEVYHPHIGVVGCIASNMKMMTECLKPNPDWDLGYYERVRQGMVEHVNGMDDDPRFPIIPQRVVADVRRAMPSDGIIALDNGVYKIWFARNYAAHGPNTVLLDNALATMGAGLPSAMGARIVHPDRKVMAICGDGGFMMNSQEIETAVRLKQNLVVMILRDDAYGMIKWKQAGMGFKNWGLDYGNPDFVKYAEAYGAHGHRVAATDDLRSTLQSCLDTPGVHVVEVPVDYSENERVLIDELSAKTCLI